MRISFYRHDIWMVFIIDKQQNMWLFSGMNSSLYHRLSIASIDTEGIEVSAIQDKTESQWLTGISQNTFLPNR